MLRIFLESMVPPSAFTLLVTEIYSFCNTFTVRGGAPSWAPLRNPNKQTEKSWSASFPATRNKVLDAHREAMRGDLCPVADEGWVCKYARLSMLQAAYCTIMTRAAGEIGPGLTLSSTLDSRIDTALAYMA